MENPRVAHLLKRIEIRKVLVELGVLSRYDITERNVTCPFHAFGRERSPSARCYEESDISPSGHFHCFTCGRTWGPVNLVMEYKGWEYWTSVKWLERTFGVIPPPLEDIVAQEIAVVLEAPVAVSSLPHKLDTADLFLRRHKRFFGTVKFRLYSDISDLLRWQMEQGDSEAPARITKFVNQLKKVLGFDG